MVPISIVSQAEEREREKGKEVTQSQEERVHTEEREKGEVANAKEEEREQAEVTR
jgi:hypothetical protein